MPKHPLSPVEAQLLMLALERRAPALQAFQSAVAPIIHAHADAITDKHAALDFGTDDEGKTWYLSEPEAP